MGLDSIVNVNITAETASVTQAGFGVPLVIGSDAASILPDAHSPRLYASAADMLDDGFAASDASFRAVNAILSQNPKVPGVLVGGRAGPPEGIADDILAIQGANDDWYGLVLAEPGSGAEESIFPAAQVIEGMRKIFGAVSGDPDILDPNETGDVASQLKASGYARTFLLYGDPGDHGAAAWIGAMFPRDPGSATWKFKTLRGVPTSTLTATQIAALREKNCNYYTEVGGVSITQEGVTSSGEYIDITRGLDWLQARLQEDVFGQLARADKIPYTDAGVAIIEATVRARLSNAVGVGLLAEDPAPTVTVPQVRDVPANDRANRHLPDVRFEAVLAGAIHSLTINGTVTV